MKKSALCLLAVVVCGSALSQDLVAFRNNKGLWGFKNKTGKTVIEPAYAYRPGDFREGRAVVAQSYTQRGVIDETGKLVVPTLYQTVSDYKNGFAVVTQVQIDTVRKINGQPRRNTLKGIVDSNGKTIVPVKYTNINGDFSNGWFVIADTGGARKFYIDTKGNFFEPPAGLVVQPDPVDGKKFIAHKSYKYGLVDKNFREVLPFEYNSIRLSGHPGLLIVKKGALSGLMDYNLKWVLPPTYPVISLFENGYAAFSDSSKRYGAINARGKVTAKPQFETVYRIPKTSTAYAVVKLPGSDNTGLADLATGKLIIPNSYQFGSYHYEWGLISFSKDSKKGLMDSTGRVIFHGDYQDFVTGGGDGMAWIQKDGKYGFMNKHGQVIIPAQYESVLGFSEGYGAVKSGGLWGYVDKAGKVAIPIQYKDAARFEGGVARVTNADGRVFYIGLDGKEVL